MGLLERFRPAGDEQEDWTPPAYGACQCDGHIEDVLELRIPLADGTGDVAVWALLTSGALATVPVEPDLQRLSDGLTPEGRGPFQWLLTAGERLMPFIPEGSTSELEDALFVQEGVERAMWQHRRKELAVGAPRLCINGVQCAVVMALMNPRLREPADQTDGPRGPLEP
jgi:hypothetical protein